MRTTSPTVQEMKVLMQHLVNYESMKANCCHLSRQFPNSMFGKKKINAIYSVQTEQTVVQHKQKSLLDNHFSTKINKFKTPSVTSTETNYHHIFLEGNV